MIPFYFMVLVGLTGVVSIESRKSEGLDTGEAAAAFRSLQDYLESNVTSDSLEDNLKAAEELISKSCESRECFFGLFIRTDNEPDVVKAAKRFVHLLEAGQMTSSAGCTEKTLDYLQDLNRAHLDPPKGALKEARYHLETYGRVDRLLDQVFERVMRNCAATLDQRYAQKLAHLSRSARKKIFTIRDEDVLEFKNYNFDEFVLTLIKRVQPKELESAINDPTIVDFHHTVDHLGVMYPTLIRPSCDAFEAHFGELINRIDQLAVHGQLYRLDLAHSEPVVLGQRRRFVCTKSALLSQSSPYYVRLQSRNINGFHRKLEEINFYDDEVSDH